jgi:hypothetical protein
MRQKDIIMRQLAETVTYFLEPVIPYLIIGSKKADEEAGKKVGPDVWEIKKRLWEKLLSTEWHELEVAAKDVVIAPSDPEVKQVLIQEIIRSFENNPDLAREVLFLIESDSIQKIMAEDRSVNIKQRSNDKNKVLEEFNKLLEEFIAKNSILQDPEQLEIPDTETTAPSLRVTTRNDASTEEPHLNYTHIQLDQRVIIEGSAIDIRMAKIAEIKAKNQNESQGSQAFFSLVSELKSPVKEEFMEKALDFACNIQYGDLRSQTLSLLVPILEGPRKVEFIKKALYSASNIQDEEERSLVFSSLSRHLRGSGKEKLIEHIFDFSPKIQYGDAKFQILSSLVPHLYGSKNEAIMEKAIELAFLIMSEYQRVASFSLLLPYLKEQRKEEILKQALELAFNLKDKDMRPQALSLIIPHLDESGQKEILEKALNIARGIQSQHRRAQALSSLASYLDEQGK